MGRLIDLAVFVALIVGIWYLGDAVDKVYINWALPPVQSPLQAPHPVPVYRSASIDDYGVEESDKGWTYYWQLDTPWPMETVANWYRDETGQEVGQDPHHNPRLSWQPKGGNQGDNIEVVMLRQGSARTIIRIREEFNNEDKYLPPLLRHGLERMGLYMVILGFYTLYKDRVVQAFAALLRQATLRAKVPLYHPVGAQWYDPIRQAHWDNGQRTLEQMGFVKVTDCVHTLPRPREYARILHKHGQIYALLQFATLPRRKRMVWYEFFTLFADGSAVYTTTHRDPNFRRPKEYPLFQVPESADVKQVLNVHSQNVENHGRQVAMVAPKKILEVLSALERTVLLNKPEEKPKITLRDTAKPEALMPSVVSPPPLPSSSPVTLAPPPPLISPPQTVTPSPEKVTPTAVTAAMAQYASNREASVLGIAAVAAGEKAAEHEAEVAEKQAKQIFKEDVIGRIKELLPEADIKDRDQLALVVVYRGVENELDLETPYYMSKNSPDSRTQIINKVAMRVKQGAF